MTYSQGLSTIAMMFLFNELAFSGVILEHGSRNILLQHGTQKKIYENIIGMELGADRTFITLNAEPALYVGNRSSYYYTLTIKNDNIYIDCAYASERNKYNAAQLAAAICGLDIPLNEDYGSLAQHYTAEWSETVFNFDTRPAYKRNVASDYLLGHIGDIEIYDRYTSAEALLNAAPQKIIKWKERCFKSKVSEVFLVFINTHPPTLKYLDFYETSDPVTLDRKGEQELKYLATEKCD